RPQKKAVAHRKTRMQTVMDDIAEKVGSGQGRRQSAVRVGTEVADGSSSSDSDDNPNSSEDEDNDELENAMNMLANGEYSLDTASGEVDNANTKVNSAEYDSDDSDNSDGRDTDDDDEYSSDGDDITVSGFTRRRAQSVEI
ncbi:hypothetical protein EIP91_010360, partial [Steccherinum ochraceum]